MPLTLRHRLRRLEAQLRGEAAVLVHASAYCDELLAVPLDELRSERILTALVREGLVGPEAITTPTEVSFDKLARVHDLDYLHRLAAPETIEATFGVELPSAVAERTVGVQRLMTGGTVLAALAAWRQHKLAVNLGGGFHHAHRDRGRGFCLVNDVAVAIAELRAQEFGDPIAVIDLDLHDGDGTRALFADDPTVHTFSIHNADWDSGEALASTRVALGSGVDDRRYLGALKHHLPRMLDEHRPSLVFYLAGCDPAFDDELGDWSISAAGLASRDRYVVDQLQARGIGSWVWLLAGGYGNEAWRYSARGLIAALGGPRDPELPTTQVITASRYRHLARVLDPRELSGREPGELRFDESDLMGAAVPPTDPRVLGYYTPSGIELALERYGLLPRLRRAGFAPRVEIDCQVESGDTVRIWGDASDELLLVEVRVRRDGLTAPGLELLRVEWMLLQNPRAAWTKGRHPLPGQRHPGLRMFDDLAALMLVVCERLHLDGIVVVPSHYHVASRWHARRGSSELGMRFLDPQAEGRFRALERLLDPLPLAEASMAVELGRVVDRRSGERGGYRPTALVLPASEAARRRFDASWRARAERAEAEAEFELERA